MEGDGGTLEDRMWRSKKDPKKNFKVCIWPGLQELTRKLSSDSTNPKIPPLAQQTASNVEPSCLYKFESAAKVRFWP
jgi:hypothetical protein